MVRVHSRQKRPNRRSLRQRNSGKVPQRPVRHGCVRGHRRGQPGDPESTNPSTGVPVRLGGQPGWDDVRLGLAPRRIQKSLGLAMDFLVDLLTETPAITCVAGRIRLVDYIIPYGTEPPSGRRGTLDSKGIVKIRGRWSRQQVFRVATTR